MWGKQESYRLKTNQIEFLLEGFPENFRQAVRSAIFVEINATLDRIWEYVQNLPCPDLNKRAKAGGRRRNAGALAQPRVYEPLMNRANQNGPAIRS